ncbi:MAG: hypothetical protein ABI333_19425 [bacterium]
MPVSNAQAGRRSTGGGLRRALQMGSLALIVVAGSQDIAARARRPAPAAPKPFVTDSIGVGFLCGTCARKPACYRNWLQSNRSAWKALVKRKRKSRFRYRAGVFGEPGKNGTRGPAWGFYVVFPGPRLPRARKGWKVRVGGKQAFVLPAYVNPWGALVVEIMLFGDQLRGGRHLFVLRDPRGTVVFQKSLELVAKQPVL